jgi:hypothetical protein
MSDESFLYSLKTQQRYVEREISKYNFVLTSLIPQTLVKKVELGLRAMFLLKTSSDF